MSPATLAQLIDEKDREDEPRPVARPNPAPLLSAWPSGYENASFKLEGDDVLIFAEGKPTLRLKG